MSEERKVVRVPWALVAWGVALIITGIVFSLNTDVGFNLGRFLSVVMPIGLVLFFAQIITDAIARRKERRQNPEAASGLPEHHPRSKVKRRIIWAFVAIVVLVLIWGVVAFISSSLGIGIGGTISDEHRIQVGLWGSGSQKSRPSVFEDTREFIKLSYQGNLKTRHVPEVTEEVMDIVRDHGGRVDSFNNREHYGHVSFVLPKDNFEDFREDMEDIGHHKLYRENISGQNLLDQKIALEEQEQQAVENLVNIVDSQEYVNQTVGQRIASLNTQITTAQQRMSALENAMQVTTDPGALSVLSIQIENYAAQIQSLTNTRNREQRNLNLQNQGFENSIEDTSNQLTNIQEDEKDLIEDVETVAGNVNINKESSWVIARTVWPIRPGWVIFIILILAKVALWRMKRLPKISIN